MFLSLKLPGGDKSVTLFAMDLAGDDEFDRREWVSYDSDRSRFDCVVQRANKALAEPDRQWAFFTMFNQFRWRDTSGWEYWSKPNALVLKHALLVAASLNEPLHIHDNVLEAMIDASTASGIRFESTTARRVEKPHYRGFEQTNRELDRGEYTVLNSVVLPADMPPAEQLDL